MGSRFRSFTLAIIVLPLAAGFAWFEATAPPPFDPSAWDPRPISAGTLERLEVVEALSRIQFSASSTLHDFSGATQRVSGELETDIGAVRAAARAHFRIDPASLDTDNVDRDETMHTETLDVKRYTDIALTLEKVLPAPPEASPSDPLKQDLEVEGKLLLHGQTQPVRLPIHLEVEDGGRLRITGRLRLDMTRWGIEPPSTAWVINVDKMVTVRWNLVLMRPRPRPAKEAAK